MTSGAKKYLKTSLRWGIAAIGTWYVLSQLSWHDRALVLDEPTQIPRWETVVSGNENSPQLTVEDPQTEKLQIISRDAAVREPDKKKMTVRVVCRSEPLLGINASGSRLLVEENHAGRWVKTDQTDYQPAIPHPIVQIGVRNLLAHARKLFLLLSLAVFPLTYLITSYRWHELLKALDIRLAAERTFVLNMVGAFYNTFMPGSTGGDVLKAYYVAKQTHHRTRAVMSVIVDRVIGLLALIILGGVMAAFASLHWRIRQTQSVAIFSLVLIVGTAAALSVFYNRALRRFSGFDFLLRRMPMQERVHKAIEAMHLYGRRPGLAAAALLMSFPVHAIVILSASFAGRAFHLHIPWYYYWTVVPVAVLSGSIPISPQGAGVMEYFAILMLAPIGCPVAEAVALTMSIRLVQVLWNLTGGIFVLRGGYHTPTSAEEKQVETEDEDQSHDEPAGMGVGGRHEGTKARRHEG